MIKESALYKNELYQLIVFSTAWKNYLFLNKARHETYRVCPFLFFAIFEAPCNFYKTCST